MKATEIMVGDWVRWKNKPVQVVRVSGIKYEFGHYDVILAYCNGYGDGLETHDISSISPIPLTPEILEKNGWKKHATYGNTEDGTLEEIYMLYQHSFEVVFDNKEAISIRHFVSEEDDGYDKLLIEYRDNGYKPMYIHTLQHALRLCGFEELADKFQV